ncbi:DUF6318 family protein [Cellulosimicrobium sp. Marseille-Q4280]|uniref:DUF6318 family protein n=1 Tax=Cellulosimicrobium sp. Marseille-Q4280 TaxID=2937992 RepID=UPI00203AEBB4|nr:DUF6318 family protein [Cellulosimicrobium sp. Marseille-Q4280]
MLSLGVVVAVGLVVGGCTGDEPVEPEPSTSSAEETPEPTEEPEPTPTETGPVKPERPAAMEREDAEGAAAAAEYFIELYPYVMATGDTTEWRAMSHETCEPCSGFIDQASTIASRGDVFDGGEISAEVPEPERYIRDETTGIFPLDVQYSQDAMKILSSAGEELFSSDKTSNERRVEMGLRNGEWVVVTIAEIPA